LEDRHYVNVLGRTRKVDMGSRVAWAAWNPAVDEPPQESINNTDVVVHLAGEPVAQRWNADVKRRIAESRVLGTRNLVAGIRKAKYPPKVLVSASAVGYYGDRGDELLTEASPPGSGFLPDVCVQWEREALEAVNLGVRVAMVRIGIVLGSGGGALQKMLPAFKAGVGGKLGSGRQWMPWIHLKDLVNLFLFAAATAGLSGPVNGTSPEPVRNSDFTEALARTLHRPAVMPVPAFALKLLMGEMAGVTLESQRAVPAVARDAGFKHEFTDVSSALADVLK
jgi:uncharacterized protein (TIGR01777 family)